MTMAREGESSRQRRPVHHLSHCQALLRVAVLRGEKQWVRLKARREVKLQRGGGDVSKVGRDDARGLEALLSGPAVLLSGCSAATWELTALSDDLTNRAAVISSVYTGGIRCRFVRVYGCVSLRTYVRLCVGL